METTQEAIVKIQERVVVCTKMEKEDRETWVVFRIRFRIR